MNSVVGQQNSRKGNKLVRDSEGFLADGWLSQLIFSGQEWYILQHVLYEMA